MTIKFNNLYASLGEAFYASLDPDPLPNPQSVILNEDALGLIDLTINSFSDEDLRDFLSGSLMPKGSEPLAMVYSGHQFGGYSPRLGDGRGLLMGQVRNKTGELWDLHLKGSGKTPFSRMGDGRAVLRSCIREYLASEALFALGIATTRALSIVTSDEPVRRETIENASMLMRLSRSHIRFGSFEYFSYTEQHNELRQLCDYTILNHFPQCSEQDNPYDALLLAATEKTALLIAHWQAFGFAHGVMNTDNMSIIGQTFDYGPYGFMESYDPYYICNHSDDQGRYAFCQQPNIGYWNCQALAQALSPLISKEGPEKMRALYQETYNQCYHGLMVRKLGLTKPHPSDKQLYEDLLDLLEGNKIDYSNFFRALSHYKISEDASSLTNLQSCANSFNPWFMRYKERLISEKSCQETRHKNMCAINPKYILRNYLAQRAIQQAEMGDYQELTRLFMVLKNPYAEQPDHQAYAADTPPWGQNLQISCSS
jgi:serine/tyrosine/threonine adenylyltransferase